MDWKAQLIQESQLDPSAVSPAGARGVAQLMPGTSVDISRKLGYRNANPHDARYAIEAGAYYMRKQRDAWSSPRPADDRQRLAQGSYNTGLGNMLAAQRLCGGAMHWPEITPCLWRVTGRAGAAETIGYIEHIERYRRLLGSAQ